MIGVSFREDDFFKVVVLRCRLSGVAPLSQKSDSQSRSLNSGTNGPMEPATGRDGEESRLPRRFVTRRSHRLPRFHRDCVERREPVRRAARASIRRIEIRVIGAASSTNT